MTSASRHLGHYISLAVNFTVFASASFFLHRQSDRRKELGGHWLRYGPTYLAVLGALLVLADEVRHVSQDLGWWKPGPWPGSSQYVSNCTIRQLITPVRPCMVDSDCGTYDCGDGYYSDGPGLLCGTCYSAGENWTCSTNAETYACLSPVGWAFTVCATYLGFVLFFVATFWNADLIGKLVAIREKWQALRSQQPTVSN